MNFNEKDLIKAIECNFVVAKDTQALEVTKLRWHFLENLISENRGPRPPSIVNISTSIHDN